MTSHTTLSTITAAASSDTRATLAYAVLWGVLTVYAVLSSLDFGAGFHYWLAGLRSDPARDRVRSLTLTYLSPAWETTNVFLVLFIVGMIGFFPASVRIYGTALLLPLSAAVIVLALRGAFFAFHHVAPWADRVLAPVFGLGGLLIPALLVSFLSSAEDGAIRVTTTGAILISQRTLWLSPLNIALALTAMAAATWLSAVFLARYAARRHDTEVAAHYRHTAAWSGALTALFAFTLALVLRTVAPFHFAALASLWPLHLISGVLFAASFWAVAYGGRRRGGLAIVAALTQYALVLLAFGLTRLPWLVYPSLRAGDALTPPATFTALSITIVAGMILIAPALGLFYAMFIRPPRPQHMSTATPAVTPPSEPGAHPVHQPM
ncbi:MAG: cytochrome d ubiquinol oxidase subunit II [Ktedonobacterales bacterium]